jgi:hypothetical protein
VPGQVKGQKINTFNDVRVLFKNQTGSTNEKTTNGD